MPAVLAARLTEAALSGGLDQVRVVAAAGGEVATAAAASALDRALELLWRRGWQPAEVVAAVPRSAVPLASSAVVAECARYRDLHPVWRRQLASLAGAGPVRLTGPLESALRRVVELLGALMGLPQLPRLVPGPLDPATEVAAPGVDQRVLARVRGLLAKAESTPYAAEAEALSAKAQELMARYAFEQAVVTAAEPQEAAARRLWLRGPYLAPKAQLVDAVAEANRCRSVFYPRLGCVGLVGHETDLEITELLATSLHVQSTRAMSHAPDTGRAYRHAFLVAYAHRVHQRLTEAGDHTRLATTALVPVLTARRRAVDTRFDTLYPGIRTRRATITNTSGWTAGLTAADLADLHPHPRVAG
ncbi:uncharacterized protein DUF2786 [Actinokineospora auranticolor]|uniref:Uncharacterized protein DUF2786 n=1 Tax=Actinokineospora auranticolor TaxID=155976 RepID=A0A2S6GL00_9PSEU|nr:uncharacterized protein DUF2786 [Actinokineospora auranticolor]